MEHCVGDLKDLESKSTDYLDENKFFFAKWMLELNIGAAARFDCKPQYD